MKFDGITVVISRLEGSSFANKQADMQCFYAKYIDRFFHDEAHCK